MLVCIMAPELQTEPCTKSAAVGMPPTIETSGGTEVVEKPSLTLSITCDKAPVTSLGPSNFINSVPLTHKTRSGIVGRPRHNFNYVDLFAGIGGFHQAMQHLGGRCVLACEIDAACQTQYRANYPHTPLVGDIRQYDPTGLKDYTVLCAGFPCQPFSKAGQQQGFNDKRSGDLFYHVLKFIRSNPQLKFIILENVRNLADKKENWQEIQDRLTELGFCITREPIIVSPVSLGIPQTRERVFILGIRNNVRDKTRLKDESCISREDLKLSQDCRKSKCTAEAAFSILQKRVSNKYMVSDEQAELIKAWDEFREKVKISTIGFPIWIFCFGCDIDDDEKFRQSINYYSMPKWKRRFADHNRELYKTNRTVIDEWVKKYHMLNRIKIHQKFEWNCGTDCRSAKDCIIQFRQSGIRFKRPDYFPSLVAMTSNTPIIWDDHKKNFRHITPKEASRIQSFDPHYKVRVSDKCSYHQFGNSVNVDVVRELGSRLFQLEMKQ